MTMSVAVVVSSRCLYPRTCWPLLPQQDPSTGYTFEQERKKRESAAQTLKRKAAVEELVELRQQRRVLDDVCTILENDANKLTEEAEGKAGSKMAQLITKSNTLKRRYKEKKEEEVKLDKTIEQLP